MADKNGLFLNFVSNKMLHENPKKDGSGSVINVSISCPQSATGVGSFAVNPGQILPATKGKKGEPRVEVEGYSSVLLGKAEGKKKVSIITKKATAKKPAQYGTIEMTNEEIQALYNAERKAYREAQAEA